MEECPFATFPIRDSQGHRICQPCAAPCIECDTYYLCKKCLPGGYFIQDGLCSPCM